MIYGTYNVQRSTAKMTEIIAKMKKMGIDLLLFSRTKHEVSGSEMFGKQFHLYIGISKKSC